MAGYAAEIDGLKETLAGMDRLARLDVQKDLRAEFHRVAEDAISEAHRRAHTKMQKRAAGTLSAFNASGKVSASSATGAALRFGGGFAGSFGAEFGAQRNLRRTVSSFGFYTGWNQFQVWRGSDAGAGYFLWPGIRSAVESNLDVLADAVARISFDDAPAARGRSFMDSVFASAFPKG